ncbi:MAG: hypothetical protein AAFQ13_01850 [Pseudomonadota bacterium]
MSTISGFSRRTGFAIIPGGEAGEHAVPGNIKAGDTLVAAIQLTDADPPVPTNRLSEFSIPASSEGLVENTTTDTTGDFVCLVWVSEE